VAAARTATCTVFEQTAPALLRCRFVFAAAVVAGEAAAVTSRWQATCCATPARWPWPAGARPPDGVNDARVEFSYDGGRAYSRGVAGEATDTGRRC